MKYFSMFTGIGGFELGIQRSCIKRKREGVETFIRNKERQYIEPTNNSAERFTCVGYSEIDKWSIKTYKKNFGKEVRNYGDATTIEPEELPDFDMLCGGFPCQAFSIAGKRRGFEDTRGTLFFDIERILAVKRPKIIFLENVKGLLSHEKGETFRVIIQRLESLGYNTQWMVLNSKFFGVPQNRERVFIIGSLRGTSRPEILPFGQNATEVQRIHGEKTARCLDANMWKGVDPKGYFEKGRRNIIYKSHRANEIARIYDPKGIAPTLHLKTGGWQKPKISIPKKKIRTKSPKVEEIQPYLRYWREKRGITIAKIEKIFESQAPHHWFEKIKFASLPNVDQWIKLKKILNFDDKFDKIMTEHRLMTEYEIMKEHKKRHKKKGHGFGIIEKNPKEIANTVTTFSEKTQIINDGWYVRRLTPIECERLQGFPDNWTAGVSDTQRYKQLGNAVTVNVIEAIARKLIK